MKDKYTMLEDIETLVKDQCIEDITSEIVDTDVGLLLCIVEEFQGGTRRFTVFIDDPLVYKVGLCVSEPVDDDFDYGGGVFTCTGANFHNEDDVVTYIVNEIGKEVL